jgi:hypothetical protein
MLPRAVRSTMAASLHKAVAPGRLLCEYPADDWAAVGVRSCCNQARCKGTHFGQNRLRARAAYNIGGVAKVQDALVKVKRQQGIAQLQQDGNS